MPGSLHEYLAGATQKAATDLEAAFLRLPENKRGWSPGGTARTALTQREPVGTSAIVAAAARLECDGSDIVLLVPSGGWLKRAYKQGVFQQNGDALDQLLARRGWTHIDQEGSGWVYTNGTRTLKVSFHMFSGHYQVWAAQGAWQRDPIRSN